ncbi:MAG: hypothetical protein JSS65_12285 [Armatimonadetes bacterium]|nr:hypothetical protein [Armatimonadota bacterium]
MPLQLRQVKDEDGVVLERLVQLYLHDCSKFSHQTLDDHGLFLAETASFYTQDNRHKAYLFWLAGRLAGFATIEFLADGHMMKDFFVLWPFRRLGVGEEVARIIFEEHPGPWTVPFDEANDVARAFWRAVVYRFSRKDFAEIRCVDGQLALRFESVPRPDLTGFQGTQPRFRTELNPETP